MQDAGDSDDGVAGVELVRQGRAVVDPGVRKQGLLNTRLAVQEPHRSQSQAPLVTRAWLPRRRSRTFR